MLADVGARVSINGDCIEHVVEGVIKYRPTPVDMAAALGMRRGAYYRRIKADNYPDAEDLRRIGQAFNIDPVWLQTAFGLIAPNTAGDGYVAIADPQTIADRQSKQLIPAADLPGLG